MSMMFAPDEPEVADALEGKVPGDAVEDNVEGDRPDKVEEAEEDPVGEPLDVVLVSRGLKGLDGEEGGKGPSDEIRDGGGERVDGVEDSESENGSEEGVALGNLGALLEGVQGRILGELAGVA